MATDAEAPTPRALGPSASPRVALSNMQSAFHTRYVRTASSGDELSLDGMRLDSPVSSNPQEPVETWHQTSHNAANPVTPRAWRRRVHAVAVLPHASSD